MLRHDLWFERECQGVRWLLILYQGGQRFEKRTLKPTKGGQFTLKVLVYDN